MAINDYVVGTCVLQGGLGRIISGNQPCLKNDAYMHPAASTPGQTIIELMRHRSLRDMDVMGLLVYDSYLANHIRVTQSYL